MTLRIIVVLSALLALRAHHASACIRAGEANTIVGWYEDGKYALYELVEAAWSITVDGVHTLANGSVLYDLSMANVCNGGTLHRVITETPASKKVPKSRCKGSGE